MVVAGLAGLTNRQPHSMSIIAATSCHFYVLRNQALISLIQDQSVVAFFLEIALGKLSNEFKCIKRLPNRRGFSGGEGSKRYETVLNDGFETAPMVGEKYDDGTSQKPMDRVLLHNSKDDALGGIFMSRNFKPSFVSAR